MIEPGWERMSKRCTCEDDVECMLWNAGQTKSRKMKRRAWLGADVQEMYVGRGAGQVSQAGMTSLAGSGC
jgi:hypothetical protein